MKKSFWRFLAHNDFHKPQTAASSAFHRLSLSAPLLPVPCIATRYPTSKLLAKSPENQVPSPSPRSAIAIPPAANANRFTPHENHVLLYEARAPCWKSYIGCSQPFFSVCKSNLYGNTDDYLGWGWIRHVQWWNHDCCQYSLPEANSNLLLWISQGQGCGFISSIGPILSVRTAGL